MIDDDSLYCDQCGKELKFCPVCQKPHRGTECQVCGEDLIDGKEYFSRLNGGDEDSDTTAGGQGYLIGDGMKLELKAGPFGRTSGIYPEFSSCIFVSGRHGEFARSAQGWTVMDYGSTNGTYLNGERLKPNVPYPLKQGDTLNVSRLRFTIQL
ncbi:MAG: FHA domain-containing protein [Bacteroidales bacterium]|nr:FHA domain-containing protein [Bacteroidales bacterium]